MLNFSSKASLQCLVTIDVTKANSSSNCYVIPVEPSLCLEADVDWLRSSDWLNLVFRSIFGRS